MGKRGSNDGEADDYARMDREALDLLKGAGPVEGARVLAVHMAQEVALASRARRQGLIREPLVNEWGWIDENYRRGLLEASRARSLCIERGFVVPPTADEVLVEMQPGEYILTVVEVGKDMARELEEMNRKPGRLINLDLRGSDADT